uniref:Macaca fascicularis brain cDNA clone: QmoA-12384, similar to human CGI-90 protein (CGI-90), mRNA, RefSeq: NM_016033.1 n=1 Tax=Macaca fascicularis TaxID=9541 RepID=I7GJ73_MACFA|nr:unnamed protein product [Macaca fascicularis]
MEGTQNLRVKWNTKMFLNRQDYATHLRLECHHCKIFLSFVKRNIILNPLG